ncbi:MAG: homoserine dehydrogenase, partial [Anaerolineales bacterium]|nr:homoserine dehydrogenase [Anaerolineales bacterium]
MPHFDLALLGFGNVGQALARLLRDKAADMRNQYDIETSITAIATGQHGMAINPQGLDISTAIELVEAGKNLDSLNTAAAARDSLTFIQDSGADILFETTPVNYDTGQPAISYIQQALELGMHVTTANKGPVVHGYEQLTKAAEAHSCKFLFESAVMDGAPIFSLFRSALPAANLLSFRGILNSTTNLILSRMGTGESFDEAVLYAQKIGIAETDPSGDIDGWDAAIKVAALATVLMGTPVNPADIDRMGIRGVSPEMIQAAEQQGKRWKLVCSAQRDGNQVAGRVAPELVSPDSAFYGIEGTTSIIQFETDVLGELSIIEANPGPQTTA